MNGLDSLSDLPSGALAALAVLVFCQITAMIWALILLSRNKRQHIGGIPRPVWFTIILFGQLIGPVVFLVAHFRESHAIARQHEYQHSSLDRKNSNPTSTSPSAVVSDLYREQHHAMGD